MKALLTKKKTQMASVNLIQNGDCFENTHVHDLGNVEISPQIQSDSHNAVDEFGESEIPPRIGDGFQVNIPPLIRDFDHTPHSMKCTDEETAADHTQSFLVGLPLLLTWINSVKGDIFESKKETSLIENELSHDLRMLVPGLSDVCWSAIEKDSFVLGLYIFEKNFVDVKRFVGTKEMGALLSFYYGKFYGSREYRRWSECRKTKNKKGVYGRKIFTGLRQQELLSRLLPRVSEECQNAISEVSKTFADEKMSLADYISSLKSMVGMNILIEAVGIGTGKQDLTAMSAEPSRPNNHQVGPTIPSGKACSSLTTSEIIKFLSGNYRLSKARSNDLFWEAVWPRLLARGWHSEQPKNQGYIGNNHCLVFIIPGVKKFSRRKLVKGEHYYDSVTDVLSRVAREPGMIELEDDEENVGGKKKEEQEWKSERKSVEKDENDLPTRQRHCYLQPRTPNRKTVIFKFTVVDTSLPNGRVREIRILPSEISNVLVARNDDNTPEEINTDESGSTDTVMLDAPLTNNEEKTLPEDHDFSTLYQDMTCSLNNPDISATILVSELKNVEDLKGDNNHHQSKKISKSLSRNKKTNPKNKDHAGPPSKRSRTLISCGTREEKKNGMHEEVKDESSSPQVGGHAATCRDKSASAASSSRGSPVENDQNTQEGFIDLNSPNLENVDRSSSGNKEQDSNQSLPKISAVDQAKSEPLSNMNQRRQSRRNHTPTTRALEALAHGYLMVNRRNKKRKDYNMNGYEEKAASRASSQIGGHNESANSSVSSQIEEAETGVPNGGDSDIFLKSGVANEAHEESVSGQ